MSPRGAGGSSLYLVLPLAGVPGAVEPEFETAALASGVGVGLVPVEGVDGEVEDVEGEEEDEGAAPVSSTFFPQAPSASRAARARAVAAAGLNLDASMSVPFIKAMKDEAKRSHRDQSTALRESGCKVTPARLQFSPGLGVVPMRRLPTGL